MLKLQDETALSQTAADKLVQQIMRIAPHCPTVPRGNSKTVLQGWMKHYWRGTRAMLASLAILKKEQRDTLVADLADAILDRQSDAISLAF